MRPSCCKRFVLLLSLLMLSLAGCRAASKRPVFEPVASEPPTGAFLPGRWLVVQMQEETCRYWLVPVSAFVSNMPSLTDALVLPCDKVDDIAIVGNTTLLHAPCALAGAGSDACWLAAQWSKHPRWQKTPLHAPIFLYGEDALYPCGAESSFVQTSWCRWRVGANQPTRLKSRLQPPPGAVPQRLIPLAWGPPWLLMGEEDDCEGGLGGKVWPVDRRYWLFNLTTGLPSPWPVWKAIGSQPRCLHEGESLEGYAQIDIIGWNPARPDELAFAVRRFPAADYDRPLEAYPFRTEIYVWHTNGDFVNVAALSRMTCGLWAPDGSGWLCRRLGLRGEVEDLVVLSREGKIAGQWRHPPDTAVLQWVP